MIFRNVIIILFMAILLFTTVDTKIELGSQMIATKVEAARGQRYLAQATRAVDMLKEYDKRLSHCMSASKYLRDPRNYKRQRKFIAREKK